MQVSATASLPPSGRPVYSDTFVSPYRLSAAGTKVAVSTPLRMRHHSADVRRDLFHSCLLEQALHASAPRSVVPMRVTVRPCSHLRGVARHASCLRDVRSACGDVQKCSASERGAEALDTAPHSRQQLPTALSLPLLLSLSLSPALSQCTIPHAVLYRLKGSLTTAPL
jgi:hypothetical protein